MAKQEGATREQRNAEGAICVEPGLSPLVENLLTFCMWQEGANGIRGLASTPQSLACSRLNPG